MYKIIPAGENSILVSFSEKINSKFLPFIKNLSLKLEKKFPKFIIEIIPSYTTLHITYNLEYTEKKYKILIEEINKYKGNNKFSNSKLIKIPVYYGLDVGLDLEKILEEKKITLENFIKTHSSKEYLVYAIGFSPCFAFLGTIDKKIQKSRLKTPRIKIPAGSVALAEEQTAVYPLESSGGWNIVGKTFLDLSIKNPENINKFNIGDKVKFEPIDKETFIQNGGRL
tara:strand:+ start:4234 stop:4911 length:678 start_codon:yes stop_codon:yes gene_type:complete